MKVSTGAQNCLYPMPATLIGAMVDGKPNFITIAHVGIMDFGTISLSMNRAHYTNAGIRKHEAFSINIPSRNTVEAADYCGIVSGHNADKSAIFRTFYGTLKTAPMIEECPVNMECRLVKTLDLAQHDIFIGEIVATYCDEECLTNGQLDFSKIQPLLFVMNDRGYWSLGERLASAWNIGRQFKPPSA